MINSKYPSKNQSADPSPPEWLKRTSLFRHWECMKKDILLHKWYESERAGHDVGWERASTSWMIHHRRRFQPSLRGDTPAKP